MDVAEVVEELGPMIVGGALQQLVDLGVIASGEFAFEEGQFVFCSRNFGARVRIFDPENPTFDVFLVERRQVGFPEGAYMLRLIVECRGDGSFRVGSGLAVSICPVFLQRQLDGGGDHSLHLGFV